MMLCCSLTASAQQELGMAGYIHTPSADLDSTGVARVGAQYVPIAIMPDGMKCDGEKYNSMTNYLSITPFWWIELGYGYTLTRLHRNRDVSEPTGFYAKDRYFSIMLRPLREDRWWPSIAVGGNDVWGSGEDGESGSNFYRNWFMVGTKHFMLGKQRIGVNVGYRTWKRKYNQKWNGVFGGLTYQPSFYPKLRVIGEWTGNEVNVGMDCRVFKYFLLQAALVDCKHFTGGLSLWIPLL